MHADSAAALADILYYNVRQSRGGADPYALAFADKLSVLLLAGGRRRDAARIHVGVLRDLDDYRRGGGTGGGGEKERLRAAADFHLDGLRRCGWAARPEGARTAKALYERLARRYGGLTVQPVEKWGAVDAKKDKEVMYNVGAAAWSLDVEKKETAKRDWIAPAKERWGWFPRTSTTTMTTKTEEVVAVA